MGSDKSQHAILYLLNLIKQLHFILCWVFKLIYN